MPIILALFFCGLSAHASIFIMAISRDGIVTVADSRMTFSDNQTGKSIAYADGLNKIIRFDSAVMAETGQGFLGDERFDRFVNRFDAASGSLAPDAILPALLTYAQRTLDRDDFSVVRAQHMAVAKFSGGRPFICGYDGKLGPCLSSGLIQCSPTDFDTLRLKLSSMTALEVAEAAKASMLRFIAANNKSVTMGGEFSAVLLTASATASATKDLWTVKNPIPARTLDELVDLVKARKIPVTLVPPATRTDLDDLLN